MKFASFPVSLLALLVSYQWHSFGANGVTIEAASSSDVDVEKEEIVLPLNALRGNRNLALGDRYFRFKHMDSGRYIMPFKSSCNNGTPLVFASRPASDLALVWYQDSNGNIHSLICGDSLTVTATDAVGTNKCAHNGKLLLRPVKYKKDHQLMDAKSISNRVESKGCSKWLYSLSKAVWVKVDNYVRIAKYDSTKSAQKFAIENVGVKRKIFGNVKDGHYPGLAIKGVSVNCYEIDSNYWQGDLDSYIGKQWIGTATTNSAGKFVLTMDFSKNIDIRDDFGDWWKRGLDLSCRVYKQGWKEMYTTTRVDNDGNWNLGTINMFTKRSATDLEQGNGCNVIKDISLTEGIAKFFKPSCLYHDACWWNAGENYETASECNEEFRQLMNSQCNKLIADDGYLYPGLFENSEWCHEVADAMAAVVDESAPTSCGTCCDQTIQKKRKPFSQWSSIEQSYKDGSNCSIGTLFESCNGDSDCNGSEKCLKGYCSDGMNGSSCTSSGDCKESKTIKTWLFSREIKAVCTNNKCDWP